MKFDLKQWTQFGLAFGIGVSLSAGYVALAVHQHDEPPVIVVEERCPETNSAQHGAELPPSAEDTLGLTRNPAYYGMSKAELEQMAAECDIRDDAPGPLTDEIAGALGLSKEEREAWERAEASLWGTGTARRFIMLTELDPELESEDIKQLDIPQQEAKIVELARATKRPEDAQLYRHMAEERAGLRPPPKSEWDEEASAWARWERYRLTRGDRFAKALAEDLGRIRVDELRRKFGGWPGSGDRHTGCEAPSDPNDPLSTMAVSEGLDRLIVARIIKVHLGEIRECYERGLEDDPTLAGTVFVNFSIEATGKVVDASVASTEGNLDHEATQSCITDTVGGWIFPKPRDAALVEVSYPFRLDRG